MEDMKVPPEVEMQGLMAYEQVGAFERLRLWRLPVSYAILALIPVLTGFAMWRLGDETMAALSFLTAIFFAVCAGVHWLNLKARHAKNVALLAKLKEEYGDKLPWVEMENHFAAVEQLKRDLAEEKGKD
jgi:hypothetical protein